MTHNSTSRMTDESEDDGPQDWDYADIPILDQIEEIKGYCPGGFAPLSIGDTIANRFQIIYKLGYGGIAIVWLCWEVATKTWKAVKVNAASNSTEDCGDVKALSIMRKNNVGPKQLEANHVMMILETFWIETPNGRHLCTVMPVHGPRACEWRTEEMRQDTKRVKNLCYQITQGLSFLHSHGICHGDFRPQNVLMRLRPGSLDHITREGMWELLGHPTVAELYTESGKRSKHGPKTLCASASWRRFREFVIDEAVIVDFGEAFTPDDQPLRFGIPKKYAAPEVLFMKGRPMLGSDIWSLGITLLELRLDDYGADSPFPIIRNMERFLGTIPIGYRYAAKRLLEKDGWRQRNTSAQGQTDSAGRFKPLTGPLDVPLDDDEEREFSGATYTDRLTMKLASLQIALDEKTDPEDPTGTQRALVPYYLPEDEVQELSDLLHQILKYDAKDRMPASQVLRHKWFKNQRPVGFIRRWWYIWVAVLFLGFLLCLYWMWNGLPWGNWAFDRSNSTAFTSWPESCDVRIIYISSE